MIRLLTVLLSIFILVGCSQGNVATTNTITDENTSEVMGTVTPLYARFFKASFSNDWYLFDGYYNATSVV